MTTERELRDWICRAAGRPAASRQPPFAEVVLERHPDDPDDYAGLRSAAYAGLLGEPDKVYRPALGAPYVEIARHPPAADRPLWSYVTSGMSDFPQVAADGAEIRTELLAATRRESSLAVNLLHGLSVRPFATGSALRAPLALPLPAALVGESFGHVLLAPPAPPLPAAIDMAGREVRLLAVVALARAEFERAANGGLDGLLAELAGRPDGGVLDARFELTPPPPSPRPDAATAVAGLGCLSDATDSPCPSCGGKLKEDWLPDDPDPFLVCTACGWSRAQSTLQHVAPYQWAVDRLREEFGASAVDFDARPGGEGVVARVSLPDRGPALVELKSPVFDINRLPDREGALEDKLSRVRDYADAGE